MRNNKGQAAMEFLMTYGWAILIVVIAVAALAAFGVFSPERFAQERCVGDSTKFACDPAVAVGVDPANTVTFQLTNGAGDEINITGITSDAADGDCGGVSSATFDGAAAPVTYQPNEEFLVEVTCTAPITEGGVFQDTFTVSYDVVGGVPGLNGRVEVVVKP